MRSIEPASDDRTTAARIRDAAIRCFAENGVAATSVRTIAKEAGVSAGLVIHHFGSKDGLCTACDEYVASLVREAKRSAMTAGTSLDLLATLRSYSDGPPIARYLARTLVDGSAHVAELVDEMVADAVEYLEAGVATGMITPSDQPKERAALLAVWMLGGLVLHEHLERLIGVDLTADLADDPAAARAYFAPAMDIFSGLITAKARELMTAAFVDPPAETRNTA